MTFPNKLAILWGCWQVKRGTTLNVNITFGNISVPTFDAGFSCCFVLQLWLLQVDVDCFSPGVEVFLILTSPGPSPAILHMKFFKNCALPVMAIHAAAAGFCQAKSIGAAGAQQWHLFFVASTSFLSESPQHDRWLQLPQVFCEAVYWRPWSSALPP